jgi:hypothetical protein
MGVEVKEDMIGVKIRNALTSERIRKGSARFRLRPKT